MVIEHLEGSSTLVIASYKTRYPYKYLVDFGGCKTIVPFSCTSGSHDEKFFPGCDKIDDIRLLGIDK